MDSSMAYKVLTFKESVRIPPNLFSMNLNKAALEILREQHERTVNKDHGIIVCLNHAKIQSEGRVLQGDGAAYFDVEFDALSFIPEVSEIVEGEVTEIVEFGAFVRLGPIDGLVHVSQVANDFFSYDKKTQSLVGRESKRSIKKGDVVKAKIATVSLKDTIPNSKIALTMRPEGMGKRKAKGAKS
ncbi:DNA-directed RNA polymerase [Candidatus Micrarchaeota archaeon]|nr:DNA-directed RNA polymerase [Candidatus Micrarchaeota archaeon]